MVVELKLGKGMISESWEYYLKNIALLLGVLSVVAIILDWYPFTMFISLPFCLIWVYCGWLRTSFICQKLMHFINYDSLQFRKCR